MKKAAIGIVLVLAILAIGAVVFHKISPGTGDVKKLPTHTPDIAAHQDTGYTEQSPTIEDKQEPSTPPTEMELGHHSTKAATL